VSQLQGVSRIRLSHYLSADVDLPRWVPDWAPKFDPRFFWPGDEFNAGATGTFIQTTLEWDFLPAQRWVPGPSSVRLLDEPAPPSALQQYLTMIENLLGKKVI
jgi:hypothetical protein